MAIQECGFTFGLEKAIQGIEGAEIMPWNSKDATRHTKKAKSAKSKRQWSAVANSVLARGGSEGSAIRQANAVVKHTMAELKGKR